VSDLYWELGAMCVCVGGYMKMVFDYPPTYLLFMNLRFERAKLECLYIECTHILKDINT